MNHSDKDLVLNTDLTREIDNSDGESNLGYQTETDQQEDNSDVGGNELTNTNGKDRISATEDISKNDIVTRKTNLELQDLENQPELPDNDNIVGDIIRPSPTVPDWGDTDHSEFSNGETGKTEAVPSVEQITSDVKIPEKSTPDGKMENGGSVKLLPPGSQEKREKTPVSVHPRVYKRRWIMLAVFCAYSFSNAYQWIHLNIISNIMLRYYNESLPTSGYQSAMAVDWLSMVYMLAYIPLIIPATWLLDKKGLRFCSIVSTFLNCLGAWLKCASVSPDRFPVLMLAQTICAVAQLFVLGIPPRLAAVWFGLNEVSTATSIGVFGNQVGIAVGFFLPPVIVPNSEDINQVGHDLSVMFYTTAGVTTLCFLLVLFFLKKEPPHPPSQAQMLAVQAFERTNYVQSLKNLFKHKGFVILMLTYGLNTGSFYAVSTLLNSIVLNYFPGQEQDAGRIGLTIVLAGVLGAILAGIWLDRTKTYKATTLGIYVLSCAGMVAFTFTLDLDRLWIVFITGGALGFFMTGYLPVGFEFAAEITYPEPEGTSSGLLNASAQVIGIILTLGMRALIDQVSVLWANICMSVALFLGTILTALIRSKYRRQAAEKEASTLDLEINAPGESRG